MRWSRFCPGDTVGCEVDCEWEGDPDLCPLPGYLYAVRHLAQLADGWYLLLDGVRGLWAESGFCAPEDLPTAALELLKQAEAAQAAIDAKSIARRAWASKPKKLKMIAIHAP